VQGGSLKSQTTFVDAYFDTPTYKLTMSDHWLRQREGSWELKVPSGHAGGSAVYAEVEGAAAVAAALRPLLHEDQGTATAAKRVDTVDMQTVLQEHALAPFGTLTTRRESYTMADGLSIHLDRCHEVPYRALQAPRTQSGARPWFALCDLVHAPPRVRRQGLASASLGSCAACRPRCAAPLQLSCWAEQTSAGTPLLG
jgi:hypothetical protein